MNPYSETHFFSFFSVLFQRLPLFFTGTLPLNALATDEVQLLVLGMESIVCALLGVWLSLKKMTMVANALSHTILLGIVLAYLVFRETHPPLTPGFQTLPLPYLLLAATTTGIVTNYLISLLTSYGRLYEDASIGLVFTSLFALGILIVNIATRSAHIGIESIMGNPDSLTPNDVLEVLPFFAAILLLLTLFHKDLLATTFDPIFSRSLGMFNNLIHLGLMVLVSFALISGFRAIGVIMILSFIASPPLLVRPFIHSIKTYLLLSTFISLLFSILGVALARHLLTTHGLATSTGGLIVTLLSITTLLTCASHTFFVNHLRTRLKSFDRTS